MFSVIVFCNLCGKRFFSLHSLFWRVVGGGICFLPLFFSCSQKKPANPVSPPVATSVIHADTVKRLSITFILGADDERRHNPYYELANFYYRLNSGDKTEIVIDTINSLLEVRDYLENHRPPNGRPWGLINLVSHGNEFIDLSVTVEPKGVRTSAKSLMEAVDSGTFNLLDSASLDAKSLVYLHGCAVGNNAGLLNAIAVAFGGKRNPAHVKASKLFEYYSYTSNNKNPQSIRRYFAKVWYAFYNPENMPDNEALAKQLRQRYPNETIAWKEALDRPYQTNPSQSYHITLGVPVTWDDLYDSKEKRPALNTQKSRSEWLGHQTGFYQLMTQTKVPAAYFDINYYNVTLENPQGEVYYAIRAKARAGVICIIQPLLSPEVDARNRYEPLCPAPADTCFFGFSQAAGRL